MRENKNWQEFLPEFLSSLFVLIIFLLSVDLYQYLTTEAWWLQDQINDSQDTLFLLFLIVATIFLPMKKWLTKWPKLGYLLFGLFAIGLIVHQKYTKFYDELQQYPKIKNLSKDWGIPGSWVRVTGRNFGQEWEPGKVFLGSTEMTIKKWGDKEVIFEIPVNVAHGKRVLEIWNNHQRKQKEYFEFYSEFNLKNANTK